MNGAGMKPRTELTLMTRPLPCSRMCGSTARVMRIEPKRLVSNRARACSIELSSAAPETPTPALFTSTSMRPDRSSTARTAVGLRVDFEEPALVAGHVRHRPLSLRPVIRCAEHAHHGFVRLAEQGLTAHEAIRDVL